MYYRYVDDTFCLSKNENEADSFLIHSSSMHPSLKFTMEKKSNHQLGFIDVFVHKTSIDFLTSVYRKPTFSSLSMRWDSFCPHQRKINLIKTLVHRALMISSKCFFNDEIEFIRSTLSKNGYPLSFLDSVVDDILNKFDRAKICTVNKFPVYLRLRYIGSKSEEFAKCITAAVGKCYFLAAVRVNFLTRTAFVSMRKDFLPHHHINLVIYKYTCSCGSDYIGRTSNRLDLRIRQHLPARVLNLELKRGQLVNTSGPSIAGHMINSRECVADFNVDRLSILSQSHSLYHLKMLETLTFNPFNFPFMDRGSLTICSSLLLTDSWFFLSHLIHFFLHYIPPFNFFGELTAWEQPDETSLFLLLNNKQAYIFPKPLCLLGYE